VDNKVKLFGLQRSGTNYLDWLLKNDFEGLSIIEGLGWKHALPSEYYSKNMQDCLMDCTVWEVIKKDKITPIIIYKEYSNWLDSIKRDSVNYFNFNRPEPRNFYWQWHNDWSLRTDNFIQYEDFIKDFEKTLNKLGKMIGSKPTRYEEPEKVKNSCNWKETDKLRYL
jgi:hypothetical protein